MSEQFAKAYRYGIEAGKDFKADIGLRNNSTSRKKSLLHFVSEYLRLRIKQIIVGIQLLGYLFGIIITEVKSATIRRMYWGRSSFYKQFFHILVVVITVLSLYTELGNKLITPQRETLSTITLNEIQQIDIDVFQQQGAFFSLQEFNEEDGVYSVYTVVEGDTLSKIAADNGISENSIRWANDIPANQSNLRVGQTVRIPKMEGVLYTVRDGDTVDSILKKVKLRDPNADRLTFLELNSGVIQDGTPIPGKVVFLPDATIQVVAPRPAVSRPRQTGSRSISDGNINVPAGSFVNPMARCSYQYSRGYSFYHRGVDWATPSGCTVGAASNGVVLRVGYCSRSIGYCVVIKHGNGLSTIYGHGNGRFFVSAGQEVAAGQEIMQSGCSGTCFGAHVHLSIAANNNDVYTCISCRINPRGIIPGA